MFCKLNESLTIVPNLYACLVKHGETALLGFKPLILMCYSFLLADDLFDPAIDDSSCTICAWNLTREVHSTSFGTCTDECRIVDSVTFCMLEPEILLRYELTLNNGIVYTSWERVITCRDYLFITSYNNGSNLSGFVFGFDFSSKSTI